MIRTRENSIFNRLSIVVCGLVLSAVGGLLLFTACQQQQRPTVVDPLAYGPDVNTLVVTDLSAVAQAKPDDFISKAVAATGGFEAWINTKKLEFDCIVTFYSSTGSFYLTRQHHEIYPWSNSVRISAVEPQGRFAWLLSQNNFTPAKEKTQYDIRNLVYAVRAITTAPARLLDKSAEVSDRSEPVKMQGLWYYPIRCSRVTGDEQRETVFYQSRDTSLVDIISFISEKESLLVRGYDYQKVKSTGLLLPTRIEVFSTNPAGVIQHRILKIDYFN
jgi:hypothetical protein